MPMQTIVALDAPANTTVYTLQAFDFDSNHSLRYVLVKDRSKFNGPKWYHDGVTTKI